MTECRNPELQDLLPDFVAESLGESDRVRVTAHLAACDACTADLALLRVVRASRPRPSVDVARIVASLPSREKRPVLQLHAPSADSPRPTSIARAAVAQSAAARPAMTPAASVSRRPSRSLWRMAATIGVVLAGGTSVIVANRGLRTFDGSGVRPAVGSAADTPASGATNPAAISPGERAPAPSTAAAPGAAASASSAPIGAGPGRTVGGGADVSVSYGALDDATEAELQQLLERVERWDGATSAEPAPSLPVVTPRGGVRP